MTTSSRPAPHGLPKLGIAILLIFLLILSAVLMHTLMGHMHDGDTMPSMGGSPSASLVAGPMPTLTTMAASSSLLHEAETDCGGLCAALCSLMGMACLMVLIVFAIAWLRGRRSRALHMLSKALAAAPIRARGDVGRRRVSLTALSIIRI